MKYGRFNHRKNVWNINVCDLCTERRTVLETRRWIYILEKKEELIIISDHLAGQVKKMRIAQIASQADVFRCSSRVPGVGTHDKPLRTSA